MIVRHYAAKGYGRMRIKNELYTRGVPKDLWDDALDGLPDQSETVEKLIEMKLKTDSPDKKELKKLTDFLLRRGFGWDEIRPAINNYINEDC
jgi:regulatory protein